VAVVQEAVEDRGRGGGVGQELGPALEVDVGGDRDRALFVGGGDEAEQVVGGDAVKRGEAEVVDLCGHPHRLTYADTATMSTCRHGIVLKAPCGADFLRSRASRVLA
jgi:hypothetical protein